MEHPQPPKTPGGLSDDELSARLQASPWEQRLQQGWQQRMIRRVHSTLERTEKQLENLGQQITKPVGIAESQKILAEKLEGQTHRIIALIRALNTLTIVLVVLTIGLLIEGAFKFLEARKSLPNPPQKAQLNRMRSNQLGT